MSTARWTARALLHGAGLSIALGLAGGAGAGCYVVGVGIHWLTEWTVEIEGPPA